MGEKFIDRTKEVIGFVFNAEQMPQLGADNDERRGRRKRIGYRNGNEVNDETLRQIQTKMIK